MKYRDKRKIKHQRKGMIMHIKTCSNATMIKSMCEYFNVSEEILLKNINESMKNGLKSRERKVQYFSEEMEKMIGRLQQRKRVKQVSFFHFSRRLNNEENDECLNLKDLLLTKTAVSDFLAEQKITFKEKNKYIELYYKGCLQQYNADSVEETGYELRLRTRLGQHANSDYCINGFLFKEMGSSDTYDIYLGRAPEIIMDLAKVLNIGGLVELYNARSAYYCYEFIMPISDVLIDTKPNATPDEKERILVSKVCERIYDSNCENIILRLNESRNISASCLAIKEEKILQNGKNVK